MREGAAPGRLAPRSWQNLATRHLDKEEVDWDGGSERGVGQGRVQAEAEEGENFKMRHEEPYAGLSLRPGPCFLRTEVNNIKKGFHKDARELATV